MTATSAIAAGKNPVSESRLRTGRALNAHLVANAPVSPVFEFPIIRKSEHILKSAIPFDKTKNAKKSNWVHFYTDDYRFECLWNSTHRYLSLLKKFDGVITPDFSLYVDYPLSVQLWNTYRNRVLSYWMQDNGINIVPNVRWGDERSYGFAFDSLEKGGTVAVGTIGMMKNKTNRRLFQKGLEKMVETIVPKTIVCVGSAPESIFKPYTDHNIGIIQIDGYTSKLFKSKQANVKQEAVNGIGKKRTV